MISDLRVLRETSDFSDHFAYMLCDGRRKNEVNIHAMTDKEKVKMNGAKKSEADQWIGNAVFSELVFPKNRIMSMRWVCTWKKIDGSDEKQAKARLVVKIC